MNANKLKLKTILKKPTSLYELFQSKTTISSSVKNKVAVNKVYFKAYDRFPAISLGKSTLSSALKKTLSNRTSERNSKKDSLISSKKLGSLLYYSAGMHTYVNPFESYRYYPSAGGRFPLELYIIPNRVEGLSARAVYHYNVKGDYLEERLSTDKDIIKGCFQQDFVEKSDAILVISGIFKRTTVKYGERGYKYALIESGHVGQNIYLVGKELGFQICGICGFFDNDLNKYLHIDGVAESVLYCFTINS